MFKGIDELLEGEAQNISESRRVLGDAVSLIQYVVAPYDLLSDGLHASMEDKNVDRALQAHVCLTHTILCSQQFVHGAMLLLRTYLSLAVYTTRSAIESCAFACRIASHEHLAHVWIDAGDSGEAYERYRNKFGVSKLFPKGDEMLRELYSRYDHASSMCHPSLYAAVGRYRWDKEKEVINYGLCEVSPDDPGEPARTFIWIIDTHVKILSLLRERLEDLLVIDETQWKSLLGALTVEFRRIKAAWKVVFDRARLERSQGARDNAGAL